MVSLGRERLNSTSKVSFSTSSIQCITYSLGFNRALCKIPGVKNVESFAMMNTVNVEIDPREIAIHEVKSQIQQIAERFGFGKVAFSQR